MAIKRMVNRLFSPWAELRKADDVNDELAALLHETRQALRNLRESSRAEIHRLQAFRAADQAEIRALHAEKQRVMDTLERTENRHRETAIWLADHFYEAGTADEEGVPMASEGAEIIAFPKSDRVH